LLWLQVEFPFILFVLFNDYGGNNSYMIF